MNMATMPLTVPTDSPRGAIEPRPRLFPTIQSPRLQERIRSAGVEAGTMVITESSFNRSSRSRGRQYRAAMTGRAFAAPSG
jgi:hypothetical protein